MTVKERLRKAMTIITLGNEAEEVRETMNEEIKEEIELLTEKTDYPAADPPSPGGSSSCPNKKRVMST